MTKYFKITGLDMGVPIEPYIVAQTNDPKDMTLNMHLVTHGDQVRYYEEATKEEYEKDGDQVRYYQLATKEEYEKDIEKKGE